MEIIGKEIFGRYGQLEFGLVAIVASSLVAALTFNLIERPVEIVRRKLKGSPKKTDPAADAAPVLTPAA